MAGVLQRKGGQATGQYTGDALGNGCRVLAARTDRIAQHRQVVGTHAGVGRHAWTRQGVVNRKLLPGRIDSGDDAMGIQHGQLVEYRVAHRLHPVGGGLQRLLGVAPPGDVTHQAQHGRPAPVLQAAGVQLDPHALRLTLAQELQLVVAFRLGTVAHPPIKPCGPDGQKLGRHHLGKTQPDQPFGGQAQHSGQRRIGKNKPVVLRYEHAVGHRFEQGPVVGFSFTHRGVGLVAFGDVA